MRRWAPSFAILVVAGFLLLASVESHPEWLRTLGIDWCGLADARDAQRAEQRRAEDIDAGLAAVQTRLQARRQIAQDLLAGQIGLFHAAALFHRLDQQYPLRERTIAQAFPRQSLGERTCRHLLLWIREDTCRTPAWPAYSPLLERMEAELENHIRVQGKVELPDVSPRQDIPALPRPAARTAW
jgi:hypothetical protein